MALTDCVEDVMIAGNLRFGPIRRLCFFLHDRVEVFVVRYDALDAVRGFRALNQRPLAKILKPLRRFL